MFKPSQQIGRLLAPLLILGLTLPPNVHPEQSASTDLRLSRRTLRPEQSPEVRSGLEEELSRAGLEDFDPKEFGFRWLRTVHTIAEMDATRSGRLYFVKEPTLSEVEGLLKSRKREYGVYGFSIGGVFYLAVEVGDDVSVGERFSRFLEKLCLENPELPVKVLFDIHNHHRTSAFPSRHDFLASSVVYLATRRRDRIRLRPEHSFVYGPRTGRLIEYEANEVLSRPVPAPIRLRVFRGVGKRPMEYDFIGSEGVHMAWRLPNGRNAWIDRFSQSIGHRGVDGVEVTDSRGRWVRWEKEVTLASVLQGFLAPPARAGLEEIGARPSILARRGRGEVEQGWVELHRPQEPAQTFRIVTENNGDSVDLRLYEQDGRPVGYVEYHLGEFPGSPGEIFRTYVEPDHRGRRLTSVLWAVFHRFLREGTSPRLQADAVVEMKRFVFNPLIALSLKRRGFVVNPSGGDSTQRQLEVFVGKAPHAGDPLPIYSPSAEIRRTLRGYIRGDPDWKSFALVEEMPAAAEHVEIFTEYVLPRERREAFLEEMAREPLTFTWHQAAGLEEKRRIILGTVLAKGDRVAKKGTEASSPQYQVEGSTSDGRVAIREVRGDLPVGSRIAVAWPDLARNYERVAELSKDGKESGRLILTAPTLSKNYFQLIPPSGLEEGLRKLPGDSSVARGLRERFGLKRISGEALHLPGLDSFMVEVPGGVMPQVEAGAPAAAVPMLITHLASGNQWFGEQVLLLGQGFGETPEGDQFFGLHGAVVFSERTIPFWIGQGVNQAEVIWEAEEVVFSSQFRADQIQPADSIVSLSKPPFSSAGLEEQEVRRVRERVEAAMELLTAGRALRWQVIGLSVARQYPALRLLDSSAWPGIRVDPGGDGTGLLADELKRQGVSEATYYGSAEEHRAFDEIASFRGVSSTSVPPGSVSFVVFLQQLLENLTALKEAQMRALGVDLQRLAADLELLEKA